MTVQEENRARQPFGVWARLRETFSILGRRPFVFFGFSFALGVLLPLAAGYVVVDLAVLFRDEATGTNEWLGAVLTVSAIVVTALTQCLLMGVLTLAASDASARTRRPLGTYVGLALRRMIVLVLVTMAVGILVGIGFAIIGILGLWVSAVYSPILPVVMVEKAGFGALGRARALSKEYRWPIVGYVLVLALILILLVAAITVAVAATGNDMAIVIAPLVVSLALPLGTIVSSVASATIHARLRAIKEGANGVELADVFA